MDEKLEKKKLYNKKYREKVKEDIEKEIKVLEKVKKEKEEIFKVKEVKEEIKSINICPEQETSVWNVIYNIGITITTTIGSGLIQVATTLAVPIILSWIYPRNNQPMITQKPQGSLSGQELIMEERQLERPIISLNSLSVI